MTRRSALLIGFATALTLAVAVALLFPANPLRRSDESLRRYLLQKVPMGSSLETLQAVATREGWKFDGTSKFLPPGEKEMTVAWVVLGEYESREVDSHWAFDDRGLTKLWVDRNGK